MPIRLANVRTLTLAPGEEGWYIGRGRAPAGLHHAQLGNPFKVGAAYAQGEAAHAYRAHLQACCRAQTREYHTIVMLAERLNAGASLVITCWCAPQPCHGQHVIDAITGYAARLARHGGTP